MLAVRRRMRLYRLPRIPERCLQVPHRSSEAHAMPCGIPGPNGPLALPGTSATVARGRRDRRTTVAHSEHACSTATHETNAGGETGRPLSRPPGASPRSCTMNAGSAPSNSSETTDGRSCLLGPHLNGAWLGRRRMHASSMPKHRREQKRRRGDREGSVISRFSPILTAPSPLAYVCLSSARYSAGGTGFA